VSVEEILLLFGLVIAYGRLHIPGG